MIPTEMLGPLRTLSDAAASMDFLTSAVVCIFALVLAVIGCMAYHRTKSRRLLLVNLAFFLFFIKYLIQILDMFLSPGFFFPDASQGVIELVAMLLIFVAIFRK